jgi:hypothetical protein
LKANGQAYPSVLHDPTLDGIQNNVGYVDSAVNSLSNTIPQNINHNELTNAAYIFNFESTNNPSGTPEYSSVVYNGQTNVNAATNFANSIMANAVGDTFSNAYPTIFTNDSIDGGTNILGNIIIPDMGNGAANSMTFSYFFSGLLPSSLPSVVTAMIMSVWWFVLYKWLVDDMKAYLSETMDQRQVQGLKQSVLGTDASSITGIGYCITISTLLIIAVGAILVSSSFHTFHVMGSGPAIQTALHNLQTSYSSQFSVATTFLPVFEMFAAYLYYLLASYLALYPAFTVVRFIVFFFIA